MYRLRTSLSALVALSLCSAVAAQSNDQRKDEPIHIEANHAEYSDKTSVSTYNGNVVMTQGQLVLHGDTLTVTRNKGNGAIEAVLVGDPATLDKAADPQNPEPVDGHSQRMEYNSAQAVVVLKGNAFVKRGGDTISGETIRHDLNSARTEARRSDSGERVKITIQPQSGAVDGAAPRKDTGQDGEQDTTPDAAGAE